MIVGRRRLAEYPFESRRNLLRIVNRHNDPKAVETASGSVDHGRRDDCRQGFVGTTVRADDFEHIDQEPSSDIDPRNSDVLLLIELCVSTLDPLQDVIRTTTSESRSDERAQAGDLAGHSINCSSPAKT